MYDLAVLGGGSAGFAAAIKAAELGGKVVLINTGLPLGGTCVNVGCVPTKYLVRAAELVKRASSKYFKGIDARVDVKLSELLRGASEVSAQLRKEKYADLLDYYGIDLVEGLGKLEGPGRIKVGGKEVEAKSVVVATGSRPVVPPIKGLEEVKYYTNENLFELGEPSSVVFIGGGAISAELSQALSRLGVKTTIFARGRLLKYEEEVASEYIEEVLKSEGVEIIHDEAIAVRNIDGGVEVVGRNGSRARGEALFVAAGRRPNSEAVAGLIKLNPDGSIKVNERMETSLPGVYAAGDVTGGLLGQGRYLENAAARQGVVAAVNAMGGKAEFNPLAVPRVVFTDPPVASVGLREEDMLASGIGCVCRLAPISAVAAAYASGELEGFIKINTYPETWRVSMRRGRIAGAVMAAPRAEELIHIFALAVRHGLTVDDLIDLVPAFPSFGEAARLAAIAFERDPTKLSCCAG
nr:MAG: mercuric reductase [Thermoproteus sp. AZ2]